MTPASGLKPLVETQSGSMRSTKAAVPKGQAPTPTLVNQGEAEILREAEQAVTPEMIQAGYRVVERHRGPPSYHDCKMIIAAALTAQGGEG